MEQSRQEMMKVLTGVRNHGNRDEDAKLRNI